MDPIETGQQLTVQRDEAPYVGTVSKVNADGTFSLRLDDGTFLHQVSPEEVVSE